MSDALLTEISKKLSDIHVALTKGGASSGGAAATGAKTPTAAAADKPKAAADKAAVKPTGPAAGTKAKGGKHTIDQVREMIRKVAADKNLGKETAKDILRDDGGGVEKVLDLKPEAYDAVYEACEVALKAEGGKEAPAEDDDF